MANEDAAELGGRSSCVLGAPQVSLNTLQREPSWAEAGTPDTKQPGTRELSARWIRIAPPLMRWRRGRLLVRGCAQALSRVGLNGTAASTIAAIRADALGKSSRLSPGLAATVAVIVNVLCDLRAQGWAFRVTRGAIRVTRNALG